MERIATRGLPVLAARLSPFRLRRHRGGVARLVCRTFFQRPKMIFLQILRPTFPGSLLRHRAARVLACALALAATLAPPVLSAQERPAALRALEKQGLTVIGTFPSPGGLTAWAGTIGPRPVAIYVAPDGKHIIAGTMLDAEGKEVNAAALEKIAGQTASTGMWDRLQNARWIADGDDKAPRTLYVFTDPNCPYCNKFWYESRPWVDAGKVQLRHVIIGVLTPTSPGKAAALLSDKNPAALFAAHERGQSAATSRAFAAGHERMLGDETIKPLARIPQAIQAQLDNNASLMAELNLQATPSVVWRDAKGTIQSSQGVPTQRLAEILGPR
ncbi:MAG TPA: thiol:disulfide interchange protein DsbG [Burkholderiales bacterium]|nr:thiol:disulfide interchange protein DsbG [Burkholderiales bacterium]